jgi:hypothetical protein
VEENTLKKSGLMESTPSTETPQNNILETFKSISLKQRVLWIFVTLNGYYVVTKIVLEKNTDN